MMEMNNLDIKSTKKDENKENTNLNKKVENTKNHNQITSAKERDKERKIEISKISGPNIIEKNKLYNKKDENIVNKINNIHLNNANKYNLNYDYNKIVNNYVNEKDQLSNRNEKEKMIDIVNKEILKNGNYKNENYANHIIDGLNRLKNNEFNYNERYNIGNGINLNLENLNKNIKEIQELNLPNLNIELEKAIDKNKNHKSKNSIEPSSSIVNLNLNLNINNNIINNITNPDKHKNENNYNTEDLKNNVNDIANSKRAVSARPDIKIGKKECSEDLLKSKIIKLFFYFRS